MNKWILHCDLNCFYASCEMIDKPYLKNIPMCVGGDRDSRHGIVLAKNIPAKKYGIKTGEPLNTSYQKCPNLRVVPPNYHKYQYYSKQVINIFKTYSDKVETFGIDEAWIDVTVSIRYFGGIKKIVDSIIERVYKELGLTISIGIADNKVYAKLGSDLAGVQEYRFIKDINDIKDLPVENLLMVGQKTKENLKLINIKTIGQLAKMNIDTLVRTFGKNGHYLHLLANGIDQSPVKNIDYIHHPKSIGKGTTTYRDLKNLDDVKIIISGLSQEIAKRLNEEKLYFKTINLQIRDKKLETRSFQMTLKENTDLSYDIYHFTLLLFKKYSFNINIRSITITVSNFSNYKDALEFNLLNENSDYYQKEKALDRAFQKIRTKFGNQKICKANIFLDQKLNYLNTKDFEY